MQYCNKSSLKFVTGTNLLAYNMLRPWPNFNVNLFNCKPYKNMILVGCGVTPNKSNKANLYTRFLYKKILSKDYVHSVRDDRTKKFVESLGFKAINTGCATMWGFSKNFCKQIPTKKSEDVIFTLTDYCKDEKRDQILIDILNRNYKNVYFWIQGSEDYNYLKTFNNIENIKVVGSSIKEFETLLKKEIDYVGTRLHAGIFSMQNKKRSIIIAVDNRAKDIKKSYNLNIIDREEIEKKLENKILSSFETKINIDIENINKWKAQFRKSEINNEK